MLSHGKTLHQCAALLITILPLCPIWAQNWPVLPPIRGSSRIFLLVSFLAHDSPQMFPCLTLPKILSRGDGTTADDDASSTLLNLPQRHFGLKALPPELPLANVILCTGSHVKRLVWTLPRGMSGRSRFHSGVHMPKRTHCAKASKMVFFLHNNRNHPHLSHYEAPTLQPCHPTLPTICIDPNLGNGGVVSALVARNTANKHPSNA